MAASRGVKFADAVLQRGVNCGSGDVLVCLVAEHVTRGRKLHT
jgi:hypothetical protein